MSVKHVFCLLILSIAVAGCAANMSVNDRVIASVGDKKITYGEFKQRYSQNYFPESDSNQSVESKEKFLNLLVDYYLKLLDAQREHVQDIPAVKSELAGYENQLAVSYVMEHEITEPMVKKIYERQKYEVRAGQVFIPFPVDSTHPGGDTLKAYNEATEVIKDLNAGVTIDSLSRKYRGGDTYYITAGNYLQYSGGEEFEDMLYSLTPGEVGSMPIRTPYGYLVIKLLDKRPRLESIRASHILIPIPGNTPDDTLKAYNRAIAVLDSIRQGVDFAKLAEDNSSDKYSAQKGGDLGYFSRGMMVRPFEEAAFNLKVGEVAGPVRTRFGYHIIKLTGTKSVPPFDEIKDKIRETYLNGGYKIDLARLVDRLKQRYGYKLYEDSLRFLYSKIDSTKHFGQTDFDSLLSSQGKQKVLFTSDKSVGTVDTVLSIASADESLNSAMMIWSTLNSIVGEAAKQMIITRFASEKAHAYANFDSLIKQYEDGILIYHIEQENVWNKVATTDSVLKPYYFDHSDRYYWPKRVDLSEIHVLSDSLANYIYDSLKSGGEFDSLAAKYTRRPGLAEKGGHWGLFADSANALATTAMTMKVGEISKPTRFEDGYSIIKVNGFVPPEQKTFEEARGEVSSDYQEAESKEIQNEWLEKLKKEFGVTIDDKTFRELLAQK